MSDPNDPTPNSPEFTTLDIGLQRIILEERALEAGLVSHYDLWKIKSEPEEPKPWYYTTDATEALRHWQDNEHLARCTETVAFGRLTLRGEKR